MAAYEKRDDKPVALPAGHKPVSEADRLHGLMSRLLVDLHGRSDVETLDESLDFDVGDEPDEVFFGVSQSEMRYMSEERLLTEAEEAARVVVHRRDAKHFKDKYYGKRENRGERSRDEFSGYRDDKGGVIDGNKERSADDGEAGVKRVSRGSDAK